MREPDDQYAEELKFLLREFVSTFLPTSYLEVGVREGGSVLVVLQNTQLTKLWLCDDWGVAAGGTGRGSHDHIVDLLADYNISIQPTFLDGNSHELLKTVTTQFQFITIDGDHSEEGGRQDLIDCWPLLELNGFLFFDDIYHPAHLYLEKVVDEFVGTTPGARLTMKMHRSGPGCAVLQKVSGG